MTSLWIRKDNYWLLDSPQLSTPWEEGRMGRLTGSTAGAFLSHSKFSTIEETIDQILGLYKKNATSCMARGVTLEPIARNWLSSMIKQPIKEIGLAVPTWDYRIGASIDGLLKDSICEIKIPNAMYKPLIAHRNKLHLGYTFDKFYHKHIWDSHYDQMQLGMAVIGVKYCYYTVYLPKGDSCLHTDIEPEDYYVERVPFNQTYFSEIYSILSDRYDNLVEPRMKELKLTRLDPS